MQFDRAFENKMLYSIQFLLSGCIYIYLKMVESLCIYKLFLVPLKRAISMPDGIKASLHRSSMFKH